ncbi:hypothetical protein SK128_020733 [Halocaridina rubra]|uniref:Uncharacterized protein n=1 Tax=Halocaridina rubra TaxID=373956 RepID=A0AAN8X5U1_HALRR
MTTVANEGFMGADCKCICRVGVHGERCTTQSIQGGYYANVMPSCSRSIDQPIIVTSPNYPNNITAGMCKMT